MKIKRDPYSGDIQLIVNTSPLDENDNCLNLEQIFCEWRLSIPGTKSKQAKSFVQKSYGTISEYGSEILPQTFRWWQNGSESVSGPEVGDGKNSSTGQIFPIDRVLSSPFE